MEVEVVHKDTNDDFHFHFPPYYFPPSLQLNDALMVLGTEAEPCSHAGVVDEIHENVGGLMYNFIDNKPL